MNKLLSVEIVHIILNTLCMFHTDILFNTDFYTTDVSHIVYEHFYGKRKMFM